MEMNVNIKTEKDIIMAAEFQRLFLLAQANDVPLEEIQNTLVLVESRILAHTFKDAFKPGKIVFDEKVGVLKY